MLDFAVDFVRLPGPGALSEIGIEYDQKNAGSADKQRYVQRDGPPPVGVDFIFRLDQRHTAFRPIQQPVNRQRILAAYQYDFPVFRAPPEGRQKQRVPDHRIEPLANDIPVEGDGRDDHLLVIA